MPTVAGLRGSGGRLRGLLLVLFLFSGGVGLAYELVWARLLALLVGSTAVTSSLVLGLFVAGLGWGARHAGGFVDRAGQPLRLYALAEVGAAVWAVLTVWLLPYAAGPYLAAVRGVGEGLGLLVGVAACAAVVLPGAFLLGMTLPAGVSAWARAASAPGHLAGARGTAWLYGVNALGAVLGTLGVGWWGIADWGLVGSTYVAGGVGTLLAACAFVGSHLSASRHAPSSAANAQIRSKAESAEPLVSLPWAFALALWLGALGLGIEIAGFRLLVFYVEGFTASLAAMLAVFVAGLGLGSLAFGTRLASSRRPLRVLGLLLLAETLVLVGVALLVLPRLEQWMVAVEANAYRSAVDPDDVAAGLRWASLVGAAALLFVPAFLLGPTFSLAVSLAERAGLEPARAVGRTYAANSLGSIAGPLFVVFVLLPLVGPAGAGWVVLAFVAALAVALLLFDRRVSAPRAAAAHRGGMFCLGMPIAVAAIVAVCMPANAATEAFLETTHVLQSKDGTGARRLLATQTDALGTASVVETAEGARILYTDDFAAAATGRHHHYMRMLGVLPMLLAREPQEVMVIAFGTGTTLGATTSFSEPRRIDAVEVSEAVLDLAPWFAAAHRNALDDARVRVVRADGRAALALHEGRLDVITLEPLMPYSPAGLPLYTREFYELARSRLSPGGTICQWVPIHAMPASLYAAFVRTFFEVFPEGNLWFFEASSALIARLGEGPTAEDVARRAGEAALDLEAAGLAHPGALAAAFVARGTDVLAAPVPPGKPDARRAIRDRDPWPEAYATPRARLATPYEADTLLYLATLVDPTKSCPEDALPRAADLPLREGTRDALFARSLEARAALYGVQQRAAGATNDAGILAAARRARIEALALAAERFSAALAVLPGDPHLARRRVGVLRALARERAIDAGRRAPAGDDTAAALVLSLLAASLPPHLGDDDPIGTTRGETIRRLVAALLERGRLATARRVVAEQRAAWPGELRAGSPVPFDRWLAQLDDAAGAGTVLAEVSDAPLGTGPDGLDLLTAELAALERAGDVERGLGAARSLAEAAGRQLLANEVLSWLADPAREGRVPRALREALAERLLPGQVDLEARVAAMGGEASADEANELARLLVALDGLDVLPRHAAGVRLALGHTATEVRVAAATAAGRLGGDALLLRLADLLLDDHLAVQRAAFGALWPHGQDLLEGFEPGGRLIDRTAVAERIRRRFAPQ